MKYSFKYNLPVLFLLLLISGGSAYSWEVYDRVIATVNDTPVIESDIVRKFERLMDQKKIPAKKQSSEKSRILDKYIEEAILEQTAEEESIIISQEKINDHIDKIMRRMNVDSREEFKTKIEKTEKISFREYREELKKSLILEQVMSIAIGISPPTTKEAKEWYNTHKKEVGYEVNIQQIKINMKSDTFSENKRASKEANDIYKLIRKGQSFEKLAAKYSQDKATKNNGGKIGWTAISDVAKTDITFANNIYSEFIIKKRKIAVIKSSSGYHIIKSKGRRITSFETVKNNIFNMLYQEKMMEQYKKWVTRKRQGADIKIYMNDYIATNLDKRARKNTKSPK